MSQVSEMTTDQFIDYLKRVADDYEESGSEATAEDYREAAGRIFLLDREVKKTCDNAAALDVADRYLVALDSRSGTYQVFDDATGRLLREGLASGVARKAARNLNELGRTA